MKVGTQAAGTVFDGRVANVDNVPQATFPLASVTAGAVKIFAVE